MNLITCDFYVDGPVLLKSGIRLVGKRRESSPSFTDLIVHGSGTSEDGIIVADGVSGALVSTSLYLAIEGP